jgi:hypothetical protein
MAALAVGAIAPLTFGLVACGTDTDTITSEWTVSGNTPTATARVGDMHLNTATGNIYRFQGDTPTWTPVFNLASAKNIDEVEGEIGELNDTLRKLIEEVRGEINAPTPVPTVVSQAVTIQAAIDLIDEMPEDFKGVTGHLVGGTRPTIGANPAASASETIQRAWQTARVAYNAEHAEILADALNAFFALNDSSFFGNVSTGFRNDAGNWIPSLMPHAQTRQEIFLVQTRLKEAMDRTSNVAGFAAQDASSTTGAVQLAEIPAVPTVQSRINAIVVARNAINELPPVPVLTGTLQTNTGTASDPVLGGINATPATADEIRNHAIAVINASTYFVNLANTQERTLVSNSGQLAELNRHRAAIGMSALTTSSTTIGGEDFTADVIADTHNLNLTALLGFTATSTNIENRVTVSTIAGSGGTFGALSLVNNDADDADVNGLVQLPITGITQFDSDTATNNVHTIGWIVLLVRTNHVEAGITGSTFNPGIQGTNVLTVRRVVITRTA